MLISTYVSPKIKIPEDKWETDLACYAYTNYCQPFKLNLSTSKGKVRYVNIFRCHNAEHMFTRQDGNFLDLYRKFDFEEYWNIDSTFQKKKYKLDYIHESILVLCEQHGWDTNPFEECYKKVLEANIELSFYFKNKLFRSANRQYHFGLFIDIQVNEYSVFEVLFDSNKVETARRLCHRSAGYNQYLESAKWNPDNESFSYQFKRYDKIFTSHVKDILAGQKFRLADSNSKFYK